jgi:uncharacterized metal-binding protein YceD (DUF177 family)
VYYIGHGESHLEVEDWIYEFINLAIPMHKTCAFEKLDGPYCNPSAREMLRKLDIATPDGEKEKDESRDNPIWKGLDKFRDLDN